jgi:hypothetical protein
MTHLNLVQSDFEQLEKKVFPRFPFCYLTFKCDEYDTHVFEVKDISQTGMQLALKNGEHNISEEKKINGTINWAGISLEVACEVKWTTQNRLGVEFSHKPSHRESINAFLSVQNFAKSLKPIHKMEFGFDVPPKLKYWLRSDGPVEVFVWQHSNGEFAQFEILMMENYIQWKDGAGLKTARIMSKRDVDTPLITEDEFVIKVDPVIDDSKIDLACTLINEMDPSLLTDQTVDFMKMKLGI